MLTRQSAAATVGPWEVIFVRVGDQLVEVISSPSKPLVMRQHVLADQGRDQ